MRLTTRAPDPMRPVDPSSPQVHPTTPARRGMHRGRRVRGSVIAVVVAGSMVLAGCGSRPASSSGTTSGASTPPPTSVASSGPASETAGGGTTSSNTSASASGGAGGANFKACMITDVGGIDDHSFNESAWRGMQAAQSAGKATVSYIQSQSESDYITNINNLLTQHCGLIVTVGALMETATQNAAKAHPDQHFAEVDVPGNGSNMVGLQYNSSQGAFLGGYLAAAYSKTGKVGVFGGLQIQPVTVYLDGYYDGVQYYNQQHHTNVQVLGWNEKTQKGTFIGSFTDTAKGQQAAANLVNQGADVLFLGAGAADLGAVAYVKANPTKAVILWADTDGCVQAAADCQYFLSSITKNVQGSVTDVVEQAASGQWTGKDYVGTLVNNGTGLAPFHDFDAKVPQSVKDELAKIKQGIIDGSITVASPNVPKPAG